MPHFQDVGGAIGVVDGLVIQDLTPIRVQEIV